MGDCRTGGRVRKGKGREKERVRKGEKNERKKGGGARVSIFLCAIAS